MLVELLLRKVTGEEYLVWEFGASPSNIARPCLFKTNKQKNLTCQEDQEFKAGLGYMVRPSLKNKNLGTLVRDFTFS